MACLTSSLPQCGRNVMWTLFQVLLDACPAKAFRDHMREAKRIDILVRMRGPDEFLRHSGAQARSVMASSVPLGPDSIPRKLL